MFKKFLNNKMEDFIDFFLSILLLTNWVHLKIEKK